MSKRLNEKGERLASELRTPIKRTELAWHRLLPGVPFELDAVKNHLVEFFGMNLYDIESMTFDELAELFERRLLMKRLESPPTSLQFDIWRALAGRALNKDQLAAEVCGGDSRRLYGSKAGAGGLKELQSLGIVQNRRTVGYYRPDAPPL